ncbi:hypothetical protein A4X13_0g2038 [Tilletia indica]|uniref:Uncharacterized protein n=1 Tax=Tilletia indica TaxID=43049 RepID=A0A177TDQ7_9BASI|nr:hypothetical protein A4X13_0g2038 [Tilletia indica]
MSRQLPPFVHRGSRAQSSAAGSVVGGSNRGGGGGGGGPRGVSSFLHSRASATPSLSQYYQPTVERRPHPLQQQAFYSDDFILNTAISHSPGPSQGQSRHHPGGNPGGPNSNGSMPPPPLQSRMDHSAHGRLETPLGDTSQDDPQAALVIQCPNCKLMLGDSFSWVDVFESLNLLVLSTASNRIRSDGELHPDDAGEGPSSLADQQKRRAAALQTSPEGDVDAASTWHTLRCECGTPLGRKYLSTSFPHLDQLRGNFSFYLQDIIVYQLGCFGANPDSQNGPYPRDGIYLKSIYPGGDGGQSAALMAEESNKMRMLLMSIGERLMRVEEKLQMGPPPPPPSQNQGNPVHFGSSSSTAGFGGSSPAPSLLLNPLPTSATMGMHRVKLVPNAQDSFLPPRIVPRLTATPAPASGPSMGEMSASAEMSSSASRVGTSLTRSHQKGAQVSSRTAVSHNGHQDTSPYSSPNTPTPAPASQPSATSTRAQNTSSVTRVNANSRPVSPVKSSASIPDRHAVVSNDDVGRDQIDDDDDEDAFDSIRPGNNASPSKRRRKDPPATASASTSQGRGSPASKPSTAARGRGRKSGGGGATGRSSLGPSTVSRSPRVGTRGSVGVGGDHPDHDEEMMMVALDDEDDELAIGAEPSVVMDPMSDEDDEDEKVKVAGRQGRRKPAATAAASGSGGNGEGRVTSVLDDRKAMPPPPLPGIRGASVPRSAKKSIAVA